MGEKSIEDWVEEDLSVDKEKRINQFRGRIEEIVRNKEGSLRPKNKVSGTSDEILGVLVAAAVENLADMRDTDVVENSDLYEFIDDDKKTVRARLSDLKDEGLIEKSGRGEYVLDYQKLETVLARVGDSDGN